MAYQIENRDRAFTASAFHKLLPLPHIHTHVELIYLKKGTSVAVLDHKRYFLEAGDIFISFPNQIHYYHDKTPVEGYLLIFAPEWMRELKEIFQSKIPDYPILHRNQLPADMISRMDTICEKAKSDLLYERIAVKGCMLTIFGEILPKMHLLDHPGDQDTIKNILKYCMENYTEPLSLERLEKELHLNKYYISHIFRERMNISYKDFINHLRVEYACSLLEKDTGITDVAYACGFASVRTFNRAFLKHMECTPREYVQQRAENVDKVKAKSPQTHTQTGYWSCCDE